MPRNIRRNPNAPPYAALYLNRLAEPMTTADSAAIAAMPKTATMARGATAGSAEVSASSRGGVFADASAASRAGAGGVAASTMRTIGGVALGAGVGGV